MTIGFIDNDIALKLMAFQLFDDAIATLGLTLENLRVLASAKHRYRRQLQKHKEYPDEILQQAIAFFEACPTASVPTVADFAQLAPFKDNIQVGEATLILSAFATNDFILLISDKKCFAALPQIPADLYGQLCGRVVCLEQIILKLIDALGRHG